MADISHTSIVNRALTLVGARRIADIADEDTYTARVAMLYWGELDTILDVAEWSFGVRTIALTKLDAVPAGWLAAHQMPSPLVRIGGPRLLGKTARFEPEQRITDFEITETEIRCDWTETVYGRFRVRAEPVNWPGSFAQLVHMAVASAFARSIREEGGLADTLYAYAYGTPSQLFQGGLFKVARDADNQAEPQRHLEGGDAFVADRQVVDGTYTYRF